MIAGESEIADGKKQNLRTAQHDIFIGQSARGFLLWESRSRYQDRE